MAKLTKRLDSNLDEYMLAQASVEGLISKLYNKVIVQLESDMDRETVREFKTDYQTKVIDLIEKGYLWNAVQEMKTILNTYGFAHL